MERNEDIVLDISGSSTLTDNLICPLGQTVFIRIRDSE